LSSGGGSVKKKKKNCAVISFAFCIFGHQGEKKNDDKGSKTKNKG
jgi:hypothetical protein